MGESIESPLLYHAQRQKRTQKDEVAPDVISTNLDVIDHLKDSRLTNHVIDDFRRHV